MAASKWAKGAPRARGISPAQIKMLWGAARKAGLDSDMLYARVLAETGKDSIRAMSAAEAAALTDKLIGRPSQSIYRATEAQVGVIRGLERELGWADEPERLMGWLRSRWGVDRPEWLNSYQARACIEGMKAMAVGGRGERMQNAAR